MKRLFPYTSINKINLISIIFTGLLLSCFILIAVYNSYTQYKTDVASLEASYLKSQKDLIKNETLRILKYIKYKHQNNKHLSINDLKSEIVNVIEEVRNDSDGTGYIFIYTFDGINVADPILKKNSGKNLIDFKDTNGKKVIKELIDVSKNKNGGYVNYIWNKPTTNTPAPKVSYAISYKPWKWMIGRGVYLDNIENVLKNKKEQYYKQISQYILQLFFLVIVLFIIGFVIYRYFMNIIKNDLEIIATTSNTLENINTKNLTFKEFKKVAYHINKMNDNLQDLNKNLEIKVAMRTKELEKSEQYAMKLVKRQDKFIKDAIHEINTPLSIIISNIDLFKLKFNSNKYLSKIEAGSKIIHNIYNDLEYMVKKDRIEYNKQKFDISLFIINRVDFFNEIAIGNNLELKVNIEDDIYIDFNQTLLQRVCDNTLSNAIKYSYENSIININIYKENNNIIFTVINIGKTIQNTDKLFDRFYRENSSRGGFGIGLSIIKEICDKNNVILDVRSENNITTFKYIFKIG